MVPARAPFMLLLLLLLPLEADACQSRRQQLADKDVGFLLLFQTDTEEHENISVELSAPTPPWLVGTLIRNGIGQMEMGERHFVHAFDGFAKFSSFRFHGNGSLSFSARFLGSSFYTSAVEKKTITPYLLFEGVVPPFNLEERLLALTRGLDNLNVNVYRLPESSGNTNKSTFVALNDWWSMYQFNPHDLRTVTAIRPHLQEAGVFLDLVSSSHPLPEPGTTNHLTFLLSASLLPWQDHMFRLVRMAGLKERQVVAQWPVRRISYMHSFSVTQNYAILFAQPFFVNLTRMVETAQPFNSLDWEPQTNTSVYVIRLSDGKVQELTTWAMFTMHHVNAWESSAQELVVDVSTYSSPTFVASLQLDILRDPTRRDSFDSQAQLKRFYISLAEGTVHSEVIRGSRHLPLSASLDMPVINEARVRSKPYCFVYGVVVKWDNASLASIALVKKDVCSKDGAGDAVWYQHLHYPVEPWFQPDPNGTEEDDGLVMAPVLDGRAGKSFLLVLRAKNMTEVARATLPVPIPYSLHGRFFPDV